MILLIITDIIVNWLLMGSVLALTMVSFLYFAILCEKFVDFVVSK